MWCIERTGRHASSHTAHLPLGESAVGVAVLHVRVAHVGCRMLHVACNRMLAMLLTLAVFQDAMFWLNAVA